jgi:tetratricopeptide (TPR) repeat protein
VVLRETRAGPVCFLCRTVVTPIEIPEPPTKVMAFRRPERPPHGHAPKREGTYDQPIGPTDFELELEECRQALHQHEDNPHLMAKLANLLRQNGEPKEAATVLLGLGKGAVAKGFPLRAVPILKYALNLDPGRTEARWWLADAYERVGLLDDARREWETIWEHHRSSGALHASYEDLRLILEEDPHFAPEQPAARAIWEHTLRMLPLIPRKPTHVAPFQVMPDLDAHVRDLEAVVALGAVEASEIHAWSALCLESADPTAAIAELEARLAKNPERAPLLLMLALALQQAGEHSRAMALGERLIESCRSRADASGEALARTCLRRLQSP